LTAELLQPFTEYAFMRRALVATFALSLGSAPLGVLLVLRRMSLLGDALGHAMLPGVAAGFLMAGFSVWAMSAGGFVAALVVALTAGLLTRATALREDANFAALYLIALAAGVMMVTARGSSVDLMHLLFGTILAVDDASLLLIAAVASVTLLSLAWFYRPLLAECVDPGFLRSVGGIGARMHLLFLTLVAANLVAGFQALGTLMAVGMMMLPAAAARFWGTEVWSIAVLAAALAALSGLLGLLLSYHGEYPSGPAIVLVAGLFYVVSLVVGPRGGLRMRRARMPPAAAGQAIAATEGR